MKSFLFIASLFLSSFAIAGNSCWCEPTTGKDYIGAARQKSAMGFTIHWICDYKCHNGDGNPLLVKGTYKKFYAKKSENGLEGICEGMKYEPHYSMQRNDYVYMWDGKTHSFKPGRSKSADLKQWSKDNSCE